jgi:hypothetical protein
MEALPRCACVCGGARFGPAALAKAAAGRVGGLIACCLGSTAVTPVRGGLDGAGEPLIGSCRAEAEREGRTAPRCSGRSVWGGRLRSSGTGFRDKFDEVGLRFGLDGGRDIEIGRVLGAAGET